MLNFKNQKTPIITLLITSIKTKNSTHLFPLVHKLDNMISYYIKNKIDHRKDISSRTFKDKKSF